jgi:hypothetical protein
MFVPFEKLSPASRVWVFQANRPFTPEELEIVNIRLKEFTENWMVHGSPFDTSYSIKFDQFIVLAADESTQSASGCSIDSSVRVLKDLEQVLGVDLFDRNQAAFLVNDRVQLVPLRDLKQKFQDGILNGDSLSFNNLVATVKDLNESWLVPAGQTWLKRYMSNPLAKVKGVL